MTSRKSVHLAAALVVLALITLGCERSMEGLEPAKGDPDPLVFDDTFGSGIEPQSFLNSKLDAVDIDFEDVYQGSASIEITVPRNGHPTEWFAGGAFTSEYARDLSAYNALTFWAKASKPATLNEVGIGIDNTEGEPQFAAWRDTTSAKIVLNDEWQRVVIPIPSPDKLTVERGLFYYSEGADYNKSYTIWFDEMKYEYLPEILNPRPEMPTQDVIAFVGAKAEVPNTQTTFRVGTDDIVIKHKPSYFTYISSNDSVAEASGGEIRVVGPGSATITAKLGNVVASGEVTVKAVGPPNVPAPTPTHPASDVISIYSDAYSSYPVYDWFSFGAGDVVDLRVAGNNMKGYSLISFAGIQFNPPPPPPPAEGSQIDASEMTHFHIDVWVTDAVIFYVKLIDFGEDGRFGGAPDFEKELQIRFDSDPPLVSGQWMSLDIPMTDFNLPGTAHMAQIGINIAGLERTLFLDNIYFHK